jgi:hypothetical protein
MVPPPAGGIRRNDSDTEPPLSDGHDADKDVTATDLSLAWTAGDLVSTAGDLTESRPRADRA